MTEHETGPSHSHIVGNLHLDAARLHRQRIVRRVVVWTLVIAFSLSVTFVAVALYTDRPEYCVTCHEMMPYYEGWARGTHAGIACFQCHVEPGIAPRLLHKFVALREVRSHLVGDVWFPRPDPPVITGPRCLRCHADLTEATSSDFPHGTHVRKAPCSACHSQTGHIVTTAALKDAGIFRPSAPPTMPADSYASVGAGTANVKGHVDVRCSDCHDLAKTGCARCHTPKHEDRGDCLPCHRPEYEWKFTHPESGVDCTSCHKRPRNHTDEADCLTCHDMPGKSWGFSHDSDAGCDECHKAPEGHRAGACIDCHKNSGKNWAFAHPGSGSNCRSCHTAPAEHYAGDCSRCHHSTGVSFAFRHPSAGEHSWQSRPCKKCHPSGTATVSCTCHGGNPPND